MAKLRIGTPNHVSARPLIHGLTTHARAQVALTYSEPGELADALEQERLDAALVPSIEFLRGVGKHLVAGPCLAVTGRTGGVILVTNCAIDKIGRIAVSANCRTPVAALRIVLDKVHHVIPDFCVSRADADTWHTEYDAILLAGDQGLRYRLNSPRPNEVCHDIGDMWRSLHETPLVLALWAYNDASLADKLTKLLVASRDRGVKDLSLVAENAARTMACDSQFFRRFLSGEFGYDMGPAEEDGLKLLEDYALQYQLIRRPRAEPRPAHVPNSLSTTIG